MGNKGKKKSQKNRQAKALKKRSLKKAIQKQKPKRKSPQFPGMPGGIPPGMMGQVEDMAKVAEPLFNMANPTSMPQMQAIVALTQSFFNACEEQDLEKRQAMLGNVKIAYSKQPWATMEFDELADQILKRHIYFMPDSHTEEERNRFSEDELKAIVEQTGETEETGEQQFQLPDIGVSSSILDKLKATEDDDLSPMSLLSKKEEITPIETFPIEYENEEIQDEDATLEPISEVILKPEDIDVSEVQSLLNEKENSHLSEIYNFLKENYKDVDFIDENNSVLQKTLEFQNKTLDLFEQYLQHKELSEADAKAHLEGLRPFFSEFLKEYHQSSFLNCDEDQAEEYILDYYLRKVNHSEDGEKYLLSAFKLFFTFAEKMSYLENSSAIHERIEEIEEEFEETTQA